MAARKAIRKPLAVSLVRTREARPLSQTRIYLVASRGLTLRSTPDEADMVRRLSEGDTEALREIYDRYSPYLFALLVRMLGSTAEAEEVLQEVFLTLWRASQRFDPKRGTFRAWLYTMTRRRALDLLRARTSRPHLGSEEDAASSPFPERCKETPEKEASDHERADAVKEALKQLPPKQREVLDLAYFRGLSQYEIAAHLGVPVGTIKSRVRDAMIRLRNALSPFQEPA